MMIMILMNIDDCHVGAIHEKSVIYGFKIIVGVDVGGCASQRPKKSKLYGRQILTHKNFPDKVQ